MKERINIDREVDETNKQTIKKKEEARKNRERKKKRR